MLNVGLTGGIASGKSTVAALLVEKGARLIDFDALAHAVQVPDSPVWQAIVRHFGAAILQPDRTIDRRRLGEIVFANPQELERLNGMVHPALRGLWRGRIEAIRREAPAAIVLSDVPLLFERGMEGLFDLVLLVYVPAEVQLERLMARNGFDRAAAERRLASQLPIDQKLGRADLVLRNEGSPAETEKNAAALWEELRRREARQRNAEG